MTVDIQVEHGMAMEPTGDSSISTGLPPPPVRSRWCCSGTAADLTNEMSSHHWPASASPHHRHPPDQRPTKIEKGSGVIAETLSDLLECCGRYWARTSDLFGVNEALSH